MNMGQHLEVLWWRLKMVKIIKCLAISFTVIGSIVMCGLSFQNEYWLSGALWFINSWFWLCDALLENEHDE